MSGFIVMEDGRAWSAANWAYDAVIEAIATALQEVTGWQEFAEWVSQQTCAVCGPGLGRIDLREIAPQNRQRFRIAAQNAFAECEEEGGKDWREPEFFPAWLDRFQVLLQLLQSVEHDDPPESFNPHMKGLLEPTGNQSGPGWNGKSE